MPPESGPEAEPSPSQKIADLLNNKYGEEHGFDPDTCEEIATMPFDEAFETSYGYLTQAGFYPDEELADFLEEAPTED